MPRRPLLQRHRGWLVVLGAFLIQMVGFGAIYSSSAFAPEIAASLDINRAYADLVMVLSLGGGFLVSAISGSLADRLLAGLPLMSAGIAFFGTYEVSVIGCGFAGLLGAFLLSLARPEAASERRITPAKPAIAHGAALPARTRQVAMALWLLSPLGLGAGLLAFSPRSAAAEALVPDSTIRAANLPKTPARGGVRSFAVELADGTGIFDMPEATVQHRLPAVLIIHDAPGADGRAAPYVEQLLGADIAVLELHDASLASVGAALAALAADPRINPARIGVLGFGQGARLALKMPGASVRALLYPGCASLGGERKIAANTITTGAREHLIWRFDAQIHSFIGPAEYAWNYNISGGAPGFSLGHNASTVLLLHGTEDPANPPDACASLTQTLQGQGVTVEHHEIPGAGYAWDVPELVAGQSALLPAPGMPERLPIRPWPAMAAKTAAEVAGFFAQHLSNTSP